MLKYSSPVALVLSADFFVVASLRFSSVSFLSFFFFFANRKVESWNKQVLMFFLWDAADNNLKFLCLMFLSREKFSLILTLRCFAVHKHQGMNNILFLYFFSEGQIFSCRMSGMLEVIVLN